MVDSTDEVLEFIYRRWAKSKIDCENTWNNGNCYWFAHILVTRFPYLKIYYNPIEGHFVAGNGKEFFDINGCYDTYTKIELFEDIEKSDSLYYSRLVRDCIK